MSQSERKPGTRRLLRVRVVARRRAAWTRPRLRSTWHGFGCRWPEGAGDRPRPQNASTGLGIPRADRRVTSYDVLMASAPLAEAIALVFWAFSSFRHG